MKQFNLQEYLKNPNKKITTRLGNREVRIICTDRKDNNNRPIITLMKDPEGNEYTTFHTINGFVSETEKYVDKRDLFFADEEENLSEDEKIRKELINFFSKGAEYDSSTNGIKDRNIIAWLEKQGERKFEWKGVDNDNLMILCELVQNCEIFTLHEKNNFTKWLEGLKERLDIPLHEHSKYEEWSEANRDTLDWIGNK